MAANKGYDSTFAQHFLEAVRDRLQAQKWFKQEGWLVSVHHYPRPPAEPDSVTLHVFKKHWYNEDHQGIHFETFLSAKEWRVKEMPVMMHILHCDHIPGTSLKRIKLSTPFIDKCAGMVAGWPGYVFRAGKYGTHPFTCKVKIDLAQSEISAADIAAEFTRLCQNLGPIMDETLQEVMA